MSCKITINNRVLDIKQVKNIKIGKLFQRSNVDSNVYLRVCDGVVRLKEGDLPATFTLSEAQSWKITPIDGEVTITVSCRRGS